MLNVDTTSDAVCVSEVGSLTEVPVIRAEMDRARCHHSTRSEAGFRLNLGRSERGHQDNIRVAWTRRHLHHAQHLCPG